MDYSDDRSSYGNTEGLKLLIDIKELKAMTTNYKEQQTSGMHNICSSLAIEIRVAAFNELSNYPPSNAQQAYGYLGRQSCTHGGAQDLGMKKKSIDFTMVLSTIYWSEHYRIFRPSFKFVSLLDQRASILSMTVSKNS